MTEKIICVGTGIIGRSWAIAFARAGLSTTLYDTDPDAGLLALDAINDALSADSGDRDAGGLSVASELAEALDGADYVQESVAENIAAKRTLYEEMDEIAGSDTLFGSSTSALMGSEFLGGLSISPRCLVAHPTNPPHLVPLTELCPSPWTDEDVIAHVMALMTKIGQAPVRLQREIPGFLLNRLQSAVVREALYLVDEGFASPEDIDLVMSQGLGLRWAFMGPFETGHLNAAGGIREYLTKYRGSYQAMMNDLSNDYVINDDVVNRVADALEANTPVRDVAARQAWRDETIATLRQHLNNAPGLVKLT